MFYTSETSRSPTVQQRSEWVLMKSADCEVDANSGSSSRYVLYQLSMRTHLGLCASKQVSKLSEAKTLYCRNVALKYS